MVISGEYVSLVYESHNKHLTSLFWEPIKIAKEYVDTDEYYNQRISGYTGSFLTDFILQQLENEVIYFNRSLKQRIYRDDMLKGNPNA